MLLNGIRARLEDAVAERERQVALAAYKAAAERNIDVTHPRKRREARPAASAHANPPRDRGHLPRHGLRGLGRPRGGHRLGELRRAQHRPRPPVAVEARHLLPRRRHDPAHAHVARPDQGDADAHAADLHGLAGPRATAATRRTRRTRRPSSRSSASRSTAASRSPTCAAPCCSSSARSSGPSARCACARATSRSPSRRSSST